MLTSETCRDKPKGWYLEPERLSEWFCYQQEMATFLSPRLR
jgi:hypothetical protein